MTSLPQEDCDTHSLKSTYSRKQVTSLNDSVKIIERKNNKKVKKEVEGILIRMRSEEAKEATA